MKTLFFCSNQSRLMVLVGTMIVSGMNIQAAKPDTNTKTSAATSVSTSSSLTTAAAASSVVSSAASGGIDGSKTGAMVGVPDAKEEVALQQQLKEIIYFSENDKKNEEMANSYVLVGSVGIILACAELLKGKQLEEQKHVFIAYDWHEARIKSKLIITPTLKQRIIPLVAAVIKEKHLEWLAAVVRLSSTRTPNAAYWKNEASLRADSLLDESLRLAVWVGELPLVEVFIEAGAKASAWTHFFRKGGNQSGTVLMQSVFIGNDQAKETKISVLKLLARDKGSLDLKNERGETALIMAADAREYDAVKILIIAGADMNAKDNAGNTLNSMASKDQQLVQAIRDALADPDCKQPKKM